MRWAGPRFTIGFALALIVAVGDCIFWSQGSLSREWAMGILAVCSVTLDGAVMP